MVSLSGQWESYRKEKSIRREGQMFTSGSLIMSFLVLESVLGESQGKASSYIDFIN